MPVIPKGLIIMENLRKRHNFLLHPVPRSSNLSMKAEKHIAKSWGSSAAFSKLKTIHKYSLFQSHMLVEE